METTPASQVVGRTKWDDGRKSPGLTVKYLVGDPQSWLHSRTTCEPLNRQKECRCWQFLKIQTQELWSVHLINKLQVIWRHGQDQAATHYQAKDNMSYGNIQVSFLASGWSFLSVEIIVMANLRFQVSPYEIISICYLVSLSVIMALGHTQDSLYVTKQGIILHLKL